jgi:L-glyceraldehyde 3-phosphate reductase
MKLDYVDIFYSHRFDPETPLEETMGALDQAVRSGKALYAGISNYSPEQTSHAVSILRSLGTPCLIHQVKFSLLRPEAGQGLDRVLLDNGVGCIAFSPLAQGLLTNRYLDGIPADSRAAKAHGFLRKEEVTAQVIGTVKRLNKLAGEFGISLAEMALNWVKSHRFITSVLIGASTPEQLKTNLKIAGMAEFTSDELKAINACL